MLGFHAVVVASPRPLVELRPSRQPISAVFGRKSGKGKAVWIQGRDTGFRVPADFTAQAWANRRGDVAGNFVEEYRGAINGTSAHGFCRPRGKKLELLSPPRGMDDSCVLGIDAQGRILAINGDLRWKPDGHSRAYLWAAGAWTDLGAADDVDVMKDGSIFGYFWVDEKGRHVNAYYGLPPDVRKVWFRWKDGLRTLYHA